MDGYSGDEGNNELACVRSDESDKSSLSVGRQKKGKGEKEREEREKMGKEKGRESVASWLFGVWTPLLNRRVYAR